MNAPNLSTAPSTPTRNVAGLTTLVAVGLPVAAILTAGARDVEIQPGLVDWVFVGIVAAVSLATFGALVPWARRTPARAARTGIALSAVAVLLTPVAFWTMAPVIFGAAGSTLCHGARRDRGGRGTALLVSAIVGGALAAVASVAGYIITS